MLKKALLWVMTMAVIFSVGISAGYQMDRTVTRYNSQLTETVQKIAVVNLDEGIMQGDEFVNFGTRLAVPDNPSFEVTGLEQARSGIKNGEFAAYIIIPASFSVNAVSLNNEPQQSAIAYEINERLRPDIREQTVYQITGYEKAIKNNLGYMYLSAVLREFHTAQDDATKIKNYQKQDLEILKGIQGTDLVYFIELDKQEYFEGNMTELDIGKQLDKSAGLMDSLNFFFDQSQVFGRDSYEDIREQSESIVEDNQLEEYLKNLGNLEDFEGEEVLLSELTDYNTELETGRSLIRESLGRAITDIEQESNLQLKAMLGVDGEQEGLSPTAPDTVNGRFQLYKGSVKDSVSSEVMDVFQVASDSNADLASDSNAEVATDSNAQMAELLDVAVRDIVEVQVEAAFPEDMIDEKLPAYKRIKQELELSDLILVSLGDDLTINDLIFETLDDPDHDLNLKVEELSEGAFTSFEEYYTYQMVDGGYEDTLASCSNAVMAEDIKNTLTDYMEEENEDYTDAVASLSERVMAKADRLIKSVLSEEMEQALMDAFTNLISILGSSLDLYDLDLENRIILLNEEEHQEIYLPVVESITAIPGVDMEEIERVFQEYVFEPIQRKIEQESTAVDEIQQDVKKSIEKLDEAVHVYDPFESADYHGLQGILDGLYSTNADIAEQAEKKGDEMTAYADSVSAIADRNVSGMQEKILEGNEKANLQVEEKLAEAKESRDMLNQETEKMLGGFIAKLPYTRLGNGPAASAYEFMIEPTVFKTSSELKAEQLQIKVQETKQKTNFDKKDFYILVIALLIISIGYALVSRYKINRRSGNGERSSQ